MLGAGYLSCGLGVAGAVLPVLPSTIFWIIAAICFARSSPRMYARIMSCPRIGPAVEDFVLHGVIRRRGKIVALAGMMLAAIIVVLTPMGTIAAYAAVAGIVVGALYVLTRPELPGAAVSR